MKMSAFILFMFIEIVVSVAMADSLETVLIPPQTIKTPEFHDGESLGHGVVEKEFVAPEVKEVVAQKHKVKSLKQVAQVKSAPAKAVPERSIASFQEDSRFTNSQIQNVRDKDQKDKDDSLSLVRAAILRGEFGKTARENLLHPK